MRSLSGIKNIYERLEGDAFSRKLSEYVQEKQREINSHCSDNYDLFLESIEQLKETKKDADRIKNSVEELNHQIQSEGRHMCVKSQEFAHLRDVSHNISSTLSLSKYCEYVSSLAVKCSVQIESKEYYKAIDTLKILKGSLRKIREYQFVGYFYNAIPKLRSRIRNNIQREFNKNFLSVARELSEKIGTFMINTMMDQLTSRKRKRRDSLSLVNKFEITEEEDNLCLQAFDTFGIDFKQVFRFNLIYTALGEDPSVYYKNNRRTQIQGFVKKFSDSKSKGQTFSAAKNIKTLLGKILGFYAIDNYVKETTDLLSDFDIIQQWEVKVHEIEQILQTRFQGTKSADLFLEMKKFVSCFCFSAQKHLGLGVRPVVDVIEKYKKEYSGILIKNGKGGIDEAFRGEDFKFAVLKNADVQDQYREYEILSGEEMEKYPQEMDFTNIVPRICHVLETYVLQFSQYSQFLSNVEKKLVQGMNKLMGIVIKKFEVLLTRNAMEEIRNSLIVHLNTLALARSFGFFEKLVLKKRKEYVEIALSPKINRKKKTPIQIRREIMKVKQKKNEEEVKLSFIREFQRVVTFSEEKLKNSFKCQVIDMFDSVESAISWIPSYVQKEGNRLVTNEIMDFFKNSFKLVEKLPLEKRQMLLKESIRYVEENYLELILSSDIQYLNEHCVKTLLVDVQRLSTFFQEFNMESFFIEGKGFKKNIMGNLRQLLAYIKSEQITVDTVIMPMMEEAFVKNFRKEFKNELQVNRLEVILGKFRKYWKSINEKAEKSLSPVNVKKKKKKKKKGGDGEKKGNKLRTAVNLKKFASGLKKNLKKGDSFRKSRKSMVMGGNVVDQEKRIMEDMEKKKKKKQFFNKLFKKKKDNN